MSQLFKLELDAYSLGEMQALLNLEPSYTRENVINNENSLREKLLADKTVSLAKKDKIIAFLAGVRQKLIDQVKRVYPPAHTIVEQSGEHEVIRRVHSRKGRKKVERFIAPDLETAAQYVPDPNLLRHLLCIDSRFRDNYYTTLSTDYLITLPTRVKNVVSMELAAFDFPNTYYQISKSLGNNYFWLGWAAPIPDGSVAWPAKPGVDWDGDTYIGKVSITNWFYIAIPDGNYKRNEIEVVINEQIVYATSKGLRATTTDGQSHWAPPPPPAAANLGVIPVNAPQCVVDIHSLKTVLSVSDFYSNPGGTIQLMFNGSRTNAGVHNTTTNNVSFVNPPSLDLAGQGGIASNLGWILGYRMAEYTGSQSYVSEGCYDAWGTKYLYIVIDDFNKNVNIFVIPAYNSSLGASNILARISTTSATSANFSDGLSLNNTFANPDKMIKKRTYFGPVDIQRMRVRVLDEFGRTIDLNNMDLALALNLVCIYD